MQAILDLLPSSRHVETFRFQFPILQDFSRAEGEVMDLSAIDAVAGTLADDAFSFIGSAAFNGTPGQLRWQDQGGGTLLIQGNINNDTVADLTILVKTAGSVDASWFTL